MSESDVQTADSPQEATPETPYQNLWVPLFVVPAGIVIAVVVIFALFGSLAGEERSLGENLDVVVHGGKNERDQALFNLARQVSENQRARNAGEEAPWPVEEGFADRVAEAVEAVDEDEHGSRLALGALLASFDPRGVDILVGVLTLGETDDPEARLRFEAIQNLGLIGDERAARHLIPFLVHDDEGLRTVAAGALGNVPGEGVRAALEGALHDSSLDVRGTAAFSLARLDPPGFAASDVLMDLTDPSVYAAVRAEHPEKYTRADDVSRFRIQALKALARLGRPEDWRHIESLRSDDDANVVDAVLTLIRDREEG